MEGYVTTACRGCACAHAVIEARARRQRPALLEGTACARVRPCDCGAHCSCDAARCAQLGPHTLVSFVVWEQLKRILHQVSSEKAEAVD